MDKKPEVSYEDTFARLDIRTGSIVRCEVHSAAKKPSYKLEVDFGDVIGVLPSSAQLTVHYTPEQLVGMSVVGIVNFSSRNIAGFMSRALVLGVYDAHGGVVLLQTATSMPDGSIVG